MTDHETQRDAAQRPHNAAASSSDVVSLWKRAAPVYDVEVPYFQLMGARIVEVAAIRPHERVLDVACGAGACLIPAARVSEVPAVGVDIVEGMTRAALHNARAEQQTVFVAVMDAEGLGLRDESFDVVTCAFGLGFFRTTKGLREMRRVLVPTGRVVATVRGRRGPGWEFFDELCEEYGLVNAGYRGGRESSAEAFETRFLRAGFDRPNLVVERISVTFDDNDSWWRWMWSHGERGYLERLGAMEAQFQREAYHRLEPLQTNTGRLPLTQDFLVLTAARPQARTPASTGGGS